MNNIIITSDGKLSIGNERAKILIGFEMNIDRIFELLGIPYALQRGMLIYPDKKIEATDLYFNNIGITLMYKNNEMYMIDISQKEKIYLDEINIRTTSLNELVGVIKKISNITETFEDNTIIFPKLNIFIGFSKDTIESLGLFKGDYFKDLAKDHAKYKILNSKRENGILTYYFDYKK